MKRIILITILAIPLFVSGQSLSVSEFYLVENDLTALNERTKVIDDNGIVCALIKVETTQKGFSFDGGTLGIAKVDDSQPGEIWVYVPAGLRRITIRHQELGVLRDYYFPVTIERGKTYIMKLISGKVVTSVQQSVNMQYFVIHYTPREAMVEIDGEIVEGENGVAMKRLPFGKHTFRVSMANYHTETGQVMINNPDARVEQTVNLSPAYGWLKFTENASNKEASVYIDNTFSGRIPFKTGILPSGQHDVRVVKNKYLTHREQVFVTDNKVTEISPSLTANFETVSFRQDGNAEVWVNDEKIGVGNCSVDLEPGEYVVETRLASHLPQSRVIKVRIGDKAPYNLPSPVPIYGSIDISSRPVNSDVYLDGKHVGKTPLVMQLVLIGEHKVRITSAGKTDLNKTIVVREGETVTIDETLSDEVKQTYVSQHHGEQQKQYNSYNNNNSSRRSGNSGGNYSSYSYTKQKSGLEQAQSYFGVTLNYSYYKFKGEDNEIPLLNGLNVGFQVQNRLYKNLVLWWGAEYQFTTRDFDGDKWMNHNLKVPFRLGFSIPFGTKSSITVVGGPSLDFNISTTRQYRESGYTVKIDYVFGTYEETNGQFSGKESDLKLLKMFDIPLGVGIMYKYGKVGIKFMYEWGMLNRYEDNSYTQKADQLTAGILIHF